MSFDIFVVTYRVTNFLPKLVDMLVFSREKTEFPYLVFPYVRVVPFAVVFRETGRSVHVFVRAVRHSANHKPAVFPAV